MEKIIYIITKVAIGVLIGVILMTIKAKAITLGDMPYLDAKTFTNSERLDYQWNYSNCTQQSNSLCQIGDIKYYTKTLADNTNKRQYLIIQHNFAMSGIRINQDNVALAIYNQEWYAKSYINIDNINYQCQFENYYSICILPETINNKEIKIYFQIYATMPNFPFNYVNGYIQLANTYYYADSNASMTNKYQEAIVNSDISDNTKEDINKKNVNDSKQQMQDISDILNENKETINFEINTDSNANNFIWTTLTSIIQTNQLIFSMIISVLLIGVIKLALGR